MNTSEHLQHLSDLMRSNGLDALICLELSERVTSQAIIWPIASELDPAHRNEAQPARSADGTPAPGPSQVWTRALVIPSSLGAYDQARQIVIDHPVNTGEGASWSVRLAELSVPEATALFQAAQFKFRLALAVEIRG